ncbi:MAG: DUF4115 domain-containing protein [Candidatus Omnitrophica bacterium]|nr:DUF4115 domain-containing protein [Candidatus Omnitrophota bacterium]
MSIESPGLRLKKLRLEKGLTLDEVHKKTKIHLNILKSMEEDNLVNLNPIYVKGFIKIYCRFLGADPRSFVPDFKETIRKAEISPVKKENRFNLANLRPPFNIKPFLIGAGVLVVILVLFNIGKAVSLKISQIKKKKAASPAAAAVVPGKAKPVPSKAKAAVASPAPIRLGIRAKENCYVTVRSDGKVLFQGVIKKGRFESWQAKDRFDISVNNAGAVDLEINGKVISNLGRKGRALKNIVIDKEGLRIGR